MKVKQLIEILKNMPQDMEVFYDYFDINCAYRAVVPGDNIERVVLTDSDVDETAHSFQSQLN